jgi:hypothetical protein
MTSSQSTSNIIEATDQSNIEQEGGNPERKRIPFDNRAQAHLKVQIKLRRQLEKASHHIELLTEAIQQLRPPRGLIPRINPRLPETTATFTLAWEEILHATGLQLTNKLLEYWTQRHIHILQERNLIEESLKKIASPEQCQEIEEILEEVARSTIMDLKRKRPTPTPRTNQGTIPTRKMSQAGPQFRTYRSRQTSPQPGGSRDPQ